MVEIGVKTMAVNGGSEVEHKVDSDEKDGIKPSTNGWLGLSPGLSWGMYGNSTPSTNGWLKRKPNLSCVKLAGSTPSTNGWLKTQPKFSCVKLSGNIPSTYG